MEISAEIREQILTLWEQGANIFQIGKKLGLKSSTIKAKLKGAGYDMNGSPKDQYDLLRREIETIKAMLKTGKTQRQISQKYSITEQTVSLFIRNCKLFRPTVYAPLEENLEELKRLAAEGYSQEEIADHFKMFPQQVNYFCRKNGIKTNGRKRAKDSPKPISIDKSPKFYPCHIPVETFRVCRTQCYLAYKCPAAQASGAVKGLPQAPDYTVRGENNRSLWQRKPGSENVQINERSLT